MRADTITHSTDATLPKRRWRLSVSVAILLVTALVVAIAWHILAVSSYRRSFVSAASLGEREHATATRRARAEPVRSPPKMRARDRVDEVVGGIEEHGQRSRVAELSRTQDQEDVAELASANGAHATRYARNGRGRSRMGGARAARTSLGRAGRTYLAHGEHERAPSSTDHRERDHESQVAASTR